LRGPDHPSSLDPYHSVEDQSDRFRINPVLVRQDVIRERFGRVIISDFHSRLQNDRTCIEIGRDEVHGCPRNFYAVPPRLLLRVKAWECWQQ
jgi:hypothetical protein